MKELKRVNPDIVSILATRADDKQLNDFNQSDYEDSILEATKLIAKRYNIINHVKAFIVKKFTKDLELTFEDGFYGEYVVKINGHLYTSILPKREFTTDEYEYYMTKVGNRYLFNFSEQEDENTVEIFYKVDPKLVDYLQEKTTPVLPSQYRRELIDFSLMDIARKGIIKFVKDEVKAAKYQALLQLYAKDEVSVDSKLLPNDAGFEVKPWTML